MDQYGYHQAPNASPSQAWTPVPSPQANWGNGQASPLAHAQEKARTQGVVGRALLVGSVILLFLFGMLFALGAYTCLAHKCITGTSGVLISTAPLGKILTISQVASHIAPVTVPFVMGLCAYQVGAEWLQSSTKVDRNRPSPLQLGLLVSICGSANFGAAFQSLKYLLGSPKADDKRKLPTPPLLRRSLIILIVLLVLSYVVSAADAWFHATSKAIAIPFTSQYTGNVDFGREINATMCGLDWTSKGRTAMLTCGLLDDGSQIGLLSRPEGLRTISNSSSLNRVVFAQDQTAIIVPASVPPNITYTAQTIGIKTTCAGITKECLRPTTFSDGTLNYGGAAALNLQCRGPTVFNVTIPGNPAEGSLDAQGNIIPGYNIPSNPFHVGAVLSSFAYQGPQDTFLRNDSGWFIHSSAGAYNVVYCDVTVLDVIYTYASSQYTIRQSAPFSLQDARHIVTMGYETGTRFISRFVEGTGVSTRQTYEQAYALELSRQVSGLGAYLYRPKDVSEVKMEYEVLGSRLNLVPLAILVSAMLVYGLAVIFILLRIVVAVTSVPYTRLASLYLTEPLTTVHALYSPPNPVSTWQPDAIERFTHQDEGDRLYIGPIGTGMPGESTFGVARGFAK